MDHDAEVIHKAAPLHDFAEMLLWCHAPALALEIARRQTRDTTLRSAAAQRDMLHAELVDVQQGPDAGVAPAGAVGAHERRPSRPIGADPECASGYSRGAAHEGWLAQCRNPRRCGRHRCLLNMRLGPTLKLLQELDS